MHQILPPFNAGHTAHLRTSPLLNSNFASASIDRPNSAISEALSLPLLTSADSEPLQRELWAIRQQKTPVPKNHRFEIEWQILLEKNWIYCRPIFRVKQKRRSKNMAEVCGENFQGNTVVSNDLFLSTQWRLLTTIYRRAVMRFKTELVRIQWRRD